MGLKGRFMKVYVTQRIENIKQWKQENRCYLEQKIEEKQRKIYNYKMQKYVKKKERCIKQEME
jgi:hypothetical protein